MLLSVNYSTRNNYFILMALVPVFEHVGAWIGPFSVLCTYIPYTRLFHIISYLIIIIIIINELCNYFIDGTFRIIRCC